MLSLNAKIVKELEEQYLASLKMIEDVIIKCKVELWEDFNHEFAISKSVYQILSSVDYYVSKINDEKSLFPRKFGSFGSSFNKSLTKQQLIDYLDEIKEKATKIFTDFTFEELISRELYDLQGGTFSLYSSLIYNLRYTMHQVGKIYSKLSSLGNDSLPWIIRIYGDERDKFLEMDKQALTYLRQRKLDQAEKIYLELSAKSNDPVYFYNLACIYSLGKNQEKALYSLEKCFSLDKFYVFKDFAKGDSDFTEIRDSPAFQRLVAI